MRATTAQLYNYCKSENVPLFGSNYTYDFMEPYLAAYNVYDRYFKDKFNSWFYWMSFSDTTSIANIYLDFVDAIEAHFAINAKRYSELYRVQVLAATAYDIVNNYDLTETHTANRSESGNNTSGSRQDSTSGTDTSGAREDTTSGSATDGARSDSATTNAGAQTTTETGQIEGFNSSTFSDSDKKTIAAGAHSDSTSISKGAQTNTNSTTVNKGAQSDSHSETFSKGSQSDSHSLTGSETINIRRTGNIGVQTAADVIGGHLRLWESFNFYKLIFDEIAKDFLLLDNDYAYDTGSAGGGGGDTDVIMTELRRIEAQLSLTAKSSELTGLAKSSELAGLAKSSELSGLATSAQASAISLSIESLRASTLAYKNEIVDSIEGVSTDEY